MPDSDINLDRTVHDLSRDLHGFMAEVKITLGQHGKRLDAIVGAIDGDEPKRASLMGLHQRVIELEDRVEHEQTRDGRWIAGIVALVVGALTQATAILFRRVVE